MILSRSSPVNSAALTSFSFRVKSTKKKKIGRQGLVSFDQRFHLSHLASKGRDRYRTAAFLFLHFGASLKVDLWDRQKKKKNPARKFDSLGRFQISLKVSRSTNSSADGIGYRDHRNRLFHFGVCRFLISLNGKHSHLQRRQQQSSIFDLFLCPWLLYSSIHGMRSFEGCQFNENAGCSNCSLS